ncbi:hypothetical protein [Paenibacillus xerothermodurans]|uniref:hypothetical protein n=1 Tax=Paenibacillus xerothermodurans TaxID=1977292 RepID=UPI001058354E|nr:hypothetical protein [Paenibacillus xerothermodurans]
MRWLPRWRRRRPRCERACGDVGEKRWRRRKAAARTIGAAGESGCRAGEDEGLHASVPAGDVGESDCRAGEDGRLRLERAWRARVRVGSLAVPDALVKQRTRGDA